MGIKRNEGEWGGCGKRGILQGGEYVGGFKGGLKEGEGTCGVEHMEYSYKVTLESTSFKHVSPTQGQYKGGERTGGEYSITSGDVYSGEWGQS